MTPRITRAFLAAAAVLGAASTAKAYDLYDSGLGGLGWNYSQPSNSQNFTEFGGDLYNLYHAVSMDSRLVDAGVYRGVWGEFGWSNNVYWNGGGYSWDFVEGQVGTNDSDAITGLREFDYGYDLQDDVLSAGTFYFDSGSSTVESTNVAIGQRYAGIWTRADGNEDQGIYRSVTVYERAVQVARTGSGAYGANALSAFEFDNSETLSATYYNGTTFVGRNVLPVASAWSDGEGGFGPDLAGSVVRTGDIALGFFGSEGLFAKDGGWLDIRGDLTLGLGGTIYIRDGEITANTYTQYYAPGTYTTQGVITIEAGILSVRQRFAQDMVATWDQTLGFRDGAVNDTRLVLEGFGYGFDGEGGAYGPVGSSFGALRSITGDNIQNGNVSIFADGEGFGPYSGAVIGTDLGSTLTINGNINGLNSLGSQGDAFLGFDSEGQTTVNGRILSGITDIVKVGEGELLFNSSNLFTGDLVIQEGSVRITDVGALSGASGDTLVSSGASLVLDLSTGFSLAEDISIAGAGTAGTGAALYNKSGANTTTGVLTLTDSATVRVDASTSLTVGSIAATDSTYTLTLDVNGADATAGSFNATGSSGQILGITKNGTGNATVATIDGTLDTVTVNAGKLTFSGSSSTALAYHERLDIDGTSAGTLELSGAHHYGEFNVDGTNVLIKGSLTHHGDGPYDLDINGGAIVTVDTGATLTTEQNEEDDASTDIEDDSQLVVKGTFQANGGATIDLDDEATLEVKSGGIVNSDIIANNESNVTLRTGGTIVGNVDTYDSATYTVESGSTHTGDYNAYGSATVVVNGAIGEGSEFAQNFRLDGSATLKGSGSIAGSLLQTGGTVAPGNSVSILTVGGAYSISAGSLQIEIGGTSGAGVDPAGNDQLRVGGTVTVSGTAVLDFQPYNTYLPVRGGVFQVLATGAGAARATIGKFDTVETTGLDNGDGDEVRVLFDHSTGKAYGTGLVRGVQTFRDYGDNANRREIGRALWMESISRDNTVIEDENFVSTNPAVNPDGLKTFILTTATGPGGAEAATDLGTAAVSVLSAANVGEALDALSPEAYSGFGEIAVRLNRNIALQGANGRRSGDENKWGFNLGYSGEQLTSDSSSAYTGYKVSSDTAYLTADLALGSKVHLNLTAGLDDGRVLARGFSGDTNTAVFGAGLSITPESKFARLDIGASFSVTDFDAVRSGSYASEDGQDAYAVAARVTFLPKEPAVNAVAQSAQGAPSKLSLIPYVGVSYASADVQAINEQEVPGSTQLAIDAFKRRSLVGEIGLNAEYELGASTTLTGVLAFEHEFRNGGRTDMTAEFADAGVNDTTFGVRTDGLGSSIFRLGVGIRQKLGAKSSLGLGYDALLGSGVTSGQQVKADVSFRF